MTENDTIVVGRVLPRIAAVEAVGSRAVRVTWAEGDGVAGAQTVDLSPMLDRYKLYAPLRADPTLFATVRVGAYGSALVWGEDEAIDMSALALESLAGQSVASGAQPHGPGRARR
ncbi:hypothetical protein [Salinarimonas sp.]|uniref:hypothetical protein n=1 Tax=Salinarimonas sp. TaxID=2766526 RepID=UPI0032D99238